MTKLAFKSIIIGCDHAALEMKNKIVNYIQVTYKDTIKVKDFGVHSETSVDYPDIAKGFCKELLDDSNDLDGGILICGSGIGISIAANRHKGIRAALCHDYYTAQMCRVHNNANVLSFGGRTTGFEIAKQMIDVYLATTFEGGRHERRVTKIEL
mmetsp:Transcript_4437/g.6514  ORF Transcript_4437/g.6514 Transcript_4437/m.6514 type:complete len:154 (-) Transcript_4437:8-469(-)